MARTRVQDNARVSNLQYEGTLGLQDIDQDPLSSAVTEYNEMREDEFGRLEKNMTAVSDLQNEVLGEKFDNVVQMKEYDDLRKEYGISDQDMWGVDLDNEWSAIGLQKKTKRMMQDPRYQEMQREKVAAQKKTDYLMENAEKLGDLAPRLARDLNNYYESADPNNRVSAFDINVSDFIPFDLDGTMQTVNENMSDEISTLINQADDPDAAWVSQLIEKSRDRFTRIAQEYMLKDDPATRNTMLERGYVAQDENTGEYFITTKGRQEINKQEDIFTKRQEKYQSQIRLPEGGKNRFEKVEAIPDTTRWAYLEDDSAAGDRSRALDRTLYDVAVPVEIMNDNNFAGLVKAYGEKVIKDAKSEGDAISDIVEEYPEVLLAAPVLKSLEYQLEGGLGEGEMDRLKEKLKGVGFNARLGDKSGVNIDNQGYIVIDGKTLKNEQGSPISVNRLFSKGMANYSKQFNDAVNSGKVAPPRHWNPNYRAYSNQTNAGQMGGNVSTQSVSEGVINEVEGAFGMRAGGAVGKSNLSAGVDMEVVEDYDKNWDYAKMGDSYMTKKKGTEDWKPATGDAKRAIASKVFNRGNVKRNTGMERDESEKNTSGTGAQTDERTPLGPSMDELTAFESSEKGPNSPEAGRSKSQPNSYDLSEDDEGLSDIKSMISSKESQGNYNIINNEDGDGNLIGKGDSTAAGKYQMVWKWHKDDIKKIVEPVDELTPEQKERFKRHKAFSKLSDDELRYVQAYLDSPEAQEKHFNEYNRKQLEPSASRFKKKAPDAAKILTDNQIKKLVHYLGPKGAIDAAKDANWDVSPTSGKGIANSTISDYLDLTSEQLAKLGGGKSTGPNLAR